jgi:hypothetical protein
MAKQTPTRRTCGTMEVHHRLLERSLEYQKRHAEIERLTQGFDPAKLRVTFPARINVVVHVVYKDATENISDDQVASQIAALNRDYRKANADVAKVPGVWEGLVADAQIEFALATVDPQGATTGGITRTQTTRDSFDDDNAVKAAASGGADAWPADRYLNLWACSLGGGLLGYAQFPGGPPETDGVVILNTAFGTNGTATAPFNLGRTATHEVGHWLNLHHIWGDKLDCTGNDLVKDTPQAGAPNYGKPAFPHESCTNGPNGDMFMNYMDYVDDDSMFMFTKGQVTRIQAALAHARASLVGAKLAP